MSYKYLIVGQGIAGSLIALECLKRKISFLVIDDPRKSSASRIAAGLINPVTGRKYVKTWMYEELEESFISTYGDFEKLLGQKYLLEKDIIRAFPKISDQNNWDARSLSEDGSPYMYRVEDFSEFQGKVVEKIGYGKVKGYQLRMGELLADFKNYLKEKDFLVEMSFDHAELGYKKDEVSFRNIIAEHVIFCEGFKAVENPYFSELPFALAKGELLLVEIPELKTERILKDGVFYVHMGNQVYWVGATYAWEDLNEKPSLDKKKMLLKSLEKVLDVPYKVLEHKAGVRPSTDNRRPFIGTHPTYSSLHIFNGLGTKGSSLGPYWAEHFMDYLELDKQLNNEVDIAVYMT